MRDTVYAWAFAAGTCLTYFVGGADTLFKVLCLFLALDYIMGVIVAVVFKNSRKTETGGANSTVGFKGLCKKFCVVVIVGVANLLDIVLGTEMVRGGAILAFISNEAISIFENAGLMGIKLPKVLADALDILNKKENTNG